MLTFRGRRHPLRRLRLTRGEPGRHRRLGPAGVRGLDPTGIMLLGRIHDPHPPAPQSRAPFPLATAPATETSPLTNIAHDMCCHGDRHAEGAFSCIALEPDAPSIIQAPAFPPVPANHDRSKSLCVDEDKDARVLERQRICEAKRGARPSRWTKPSTDHCLAHVVGLRRVVFPAACVCDRAPHFSASIPLLSRSDSSNGYGSDLMFARPPRPAWRSQWGTPARIVCPSRGEHVRLVDGRYNQRLLFASGFSSWASHKSDAQPPSSQSQIYVELSQLACWGAFTSPRRATGHSALYFSPPLHIYGFSSSVVAPVISYRHGGHAFVSPRVVSFPSSAFESSPPLSFRQRPGHPAKITFHIRNRLFMLFS
ncbi:hypothetical protein B0H14DRAFT_3886856 [Mycena olivaceomarginata]|nr:hypothetical protein B0H14DRAFT_3886856 [Mycena olivaceomarginata]